MGDEVTKLDDDQMQALAGMVSEKILAANKSSDSNNQEPEKVDEPVQEPPKKSNDQSVSADELVEKLMDKFKTNNATENKKVFDLMWQDKLNNSINSVPGLDEFINGEDDYGNIRKEKLESIEDLQDRVSALSKLTNSFKEASAGNPNRRPVVNKKAQQKAEEVKSDYDKLEDKLANGEYTSAAQLTDDFFKTLSKEVEGLK